MGRYATWITAPEQIRDSRFEKNRRAHRVKDLRAA